MHKFINLNKLPRNKLGAIDWIGSVGSKVYFEYDDIKDYIEIVDYIPKNQKIKIKYKNNYDTMASSMFVKCSFGKILNKRTGGFKLSIGETIVDDRRDLVIIDREYRTSKGGKKYNEKWYKYYCMNCGAELWTIESSLLKEIGCSCCANKIVIEGINDIATTDSWMISIIDDLNFCKTHTHGSNIKINPVCPDCGRKMNKMIPVYKIYEQHSIGCNCKDGVSYPNKFMFNLLKQLNINFINEYSPEWIGKMKYDFYISSMNLIIEMDGGLGHGKRIYNKENKTIEQTIECDKYKDEMAKKHNLKVIRIDCDYDHNDRFEYIKEKTVKGLQEILDLTNINWKECNAYSCNNLVKIACKIKNDNPNLTTRQISEIMGYNCATIRDWLKHGNGIWCNYDPKEESRKSQLLLGIRNKERCSKQVEIFKDGISLGIFNSVTELVKQSEELFNVKFNNTNISSVCRKKRKHYKGFTFKYVNKNLT